MDNATHWRQTARGVPDTRPVATPALLFAHVARRLAPRRTLLKVAKLCHAGTLLCRPSQTEPRSRRYLAVYPKPEGRAIAGGPPISSVGAPTDAGHSTRTDNTTVPWLGTGSSPISV